MTTQTSAQTGDQSVSGRASEVKDRAAEVGGTVQEKTSEVAGTATSRATDVAGTAKDQALDVAQEAQRQARDLFGEFRGQLQQQTQQQRDRLVELLREFEDELQNMVQAGGRSGTASEVVRQVADRLERRAHVPRGRCQPGGRRALVRAPPARDVPAPRGRGRRPRRPCHAQRGSCAQAGAGERPARHRRAGRATPPAPTRRATPAAPPPGTPREHRQLRHGDGSARVSPRPRAPTTATGGYGTSTSTYGATGESYRRPATATL